MGVIVKSSSSIFKCKKFEERIVDGSLRVDFGKNGYRYIAGYVYNYYQGRDDSGEFPYYSAAFVIVDGVLLWNIIIDTSKVWWNHENATKFLSLCRGGGGTLGTRYSFDGRVLTFTPFENMDNPGSFDIDIYVS